MSVRRWLRLFLPIAALIVAVFYGYGWLNARAEMDAIAAREKTAIDLATNRLEQYLSDAIDDLRLIQDTPAVREFIDQPDAARRERLEALFGAFVRGKAHYAQLRLLDGRGFEVVRVVRAPEGARAVPAAELQDKRGLDYVTETLAAPPGPVRVSRLDLNREHGVIERPLNPVLRLSLHLRSADGRDLVLVANLRGAVLLKTISEVLATGAGQSWVLDGEGYWLLHPDPAMLWGQELDRSKRLTDRDPALSGLLEREAGTERTRDALYVFRRFDPGVSLSAASVINAAPPFVLVSRLPARRLPSALPPRLAWPLIAVLALAALGCAMLLRTRIRAARSERRERRLLMAQAAANADSLWVRENLYQFSLKVHAATGPADFGNTVMVQLAPVLGLAAGCLYAIRNGHADPIAGYGLPAGTALRHFAPGEGLVGEAARTRSERRMTPPLAGYLDLVGGAGAGAAADLRVLPLWVHSRTVGVIELAFIHVLDARQEEFLRQLIPLLAINLDGFTGSARHAA